MKQRNILLTLGLALGVAMPNFVSAQTPQTDSLRTVALEQEVLILASPKETKKLSELPGSVSLINKELMHTQQIRALKDLTGTVPNIFIPNYGSKLTSAIYIRGIGSRINTPSVGLYVDDIPFIDKSAFDFDFSDVDHIDILRGPQSTLYGRNTMGGLIKVHTKSPFLYQGTDLKLGAATYGDYSASLTHYHHVNKYFAFSTGGFYKRKGGFYKNEFLDNKRIDKGSSAGGRFRGIYFPMANLKFDLQTNYEYSDEGGYPYGEYNKETDQYSQPSMNHNGLYRRSLFNIGLNMSYQAAQFEFVTISGYQHLQDKMFIDQDFSPADIFTIMQKQNLNTFTQEIFLKSKNNSRWQWTTGLFGFVQGLRTNGPVWFHEDGLDGMIVGGIRKGLGHGLALVNDKIGHIEKPGMPFVIEGDLHADFNAVNNKELLIDGVFKTPIYSASFYHQSTINDLFVEGLSATAGFRVNFEHNRMKYLSETNFDYSLDNAGFSLAMIPKIPVMPAKHYEYGDYNIQMNSHPILKGELMKNDLAFLPRFSLQYNLNPSNSIYATVSRGYRSGGYNVQMFSDLIQSEMQTVMMQDMMSGVGKFVMQKYLTASDDKKAEVDQLIGMIPEPVKDKIKDMIGKAPEEGPGLDIKDATVYKPEFAWNYEVGSHLNLFDGRFIADYALFLLDTKNQQIAKFAESGLGRVTVNAGKSRSYGFEANMLYHATNILSLHAAYGLTHATFTEYKTNAQVDGQLVEVDYKGKRVPFVPRHTLNAGFDLNFKLGNRFWLDRIAFNTSYSGVGRIYWTEENDVSQKFYGTINARLSFVKGRAHVDLWTRNLLNKDYSTFYFESMGKGFMQKSNPIQFGIVLGCQF